MACPILKYFVRELQCSKSTCNSVLVRSSPSSLVGGNGEEDGDDSDDHLDLSLMMLLFCEIYV